MHGGFVSRVLSGFSSILAPVFCLMKIGFATGFGPPTGFVRVVSPETMNSPPLESKLIVKKSPSLRSPLSKLGLALHVVPLRQILPTWMGRPDAFATSNCGPTNLRDPSEH